MNARRSSRAGALAVLVALKAQAAPLRAMPPSRLADVVSRTVAAARGKKVILIGEGHGTVEIPEFTAELVAALKKSRRVALALEIPVENQADVDRFAAGKDGALSDSKFFKEDRDGRSSQAEAALIRRAGPPVACVEPNSALDAQERDDAMAKNVLRLVRSHPGTIVVMLTGNVHSALTVGMPWDPAFRPMAASLLKPGTGLSRADVLSINLNESGGETWDCDERTCGVHSRSFNGPAEAAPSYDASLSGSTQRYDAVIKLGPTHASVPFLDPKAGSTPAAPQDPTLRPAS